MSILCREDYKVGYQNLQLINNNVVEYCPHSRNKTVIWKLINRSSSKDIRVRCGLGKDVIIDKSNCRNGSQLY